MSSDVFRGSVERVEREMLERVITLLLEGKEKEAEEAFHRYVVEQASKIYRRIVENDEKLGDEMADAVERYADEFEDDMPEGEHIPEDDVEDGDGRAEDAGDRGEEDEDGEDPSHDLGAEVANIQRELEKLAAKIETLWDVEKEEHGSLPEPEEGDDGEEGGADGEDIEECGCEGERDRRRLILDDHDNFDATMDDAEGRPHVDEAEGEDEPDAEEVLNALKRVEHDLERLLHGGPVGESDEDDTDDEEEYDLDRAGEDPEDESYEDDEDEEGDDLADDEDDVLSRHVADDEDVEESLSSLAAVDVTMDPHREVGAGRSIRANTRSALDGRREQPRPALPAKGKGVAGYSWDNVPKVKPVGRSETFVNARRRGSSHLGAVPKGGSKDALLNDPYGEPSAEGGPISGARKGRRRR